MPVSSSPTTAYLLVIHGSRDPRPAAVAQQLAAQVSHQLSNPDFSVPLVDIACLELAPMPLHQQIVVFGDRALKAGYTTLAIVPLFLLPGVHVCQDIPEEVAIAQTMLDPCLTLQLWPYLGRIKGMVNLLAAQQVTIAQDTPTTPILLAHGSRRPGGNQPIEAIATQLDAIPAYWAVPPSLDTQMQTLAQQGTQHITVLPYFLFAGGITDAIAQKIGAMGDRYPHLTVVLGQPIGTFPDLIALLVSHLITPPHPTGSEVQAEK
ncbi:MAG: sirohydrochlorin chelatase [Cyanothece sp. SIO2G6]|nr:sirohydrochlorin chelatase [Cyanothece sp. SIO2G6]